MTYSSSQTSERQSGGMRKGHPKMTPLPLPCQATPGQACPNLAGPVHAMPRLARPGRVSSARPLTLISYASKLPIPSYLGMVLTMGAKSKWANPGA